MCRARESFGVIKSFIISNSVYQCTIIIKKKCYHEQCYLMHISVRVFRYNIQTEMSNSVFDSDKL